LSVYSVKESRRRTASAAVGSGLGTTVGVDGEGVGPGEGSGAGAGVGAGAGLSVGSGAGPAEGDGEGAGAGDAVGKAVSTSPGASLKSEKVTTAPVHEERAWKNVSAVRAFRVSTTVRVTAPVAAELAGMPMMWVPPSNAKPKKSTCKHAAIRQ